MSNDRLIQHAYVLILVGKAHYDLDHWGGIHALIIDDIVTKFRNCADIKLLATLSGYGVWDAANDRASVLAPQGRKRSRDAVQGFNDDDRAEARRNGDFLTNAVDQRVFVPGKYFKYNTIAGTRASNYVADVLQDPVNKIILGLDPVDTPIKQKLHGLPTDTNHEERIKQRPEITYDMLLTTLYTPYDCSPKTRPGEPALPQPAHRSLSQDFLGPGGNVERSCPNFYTHNGRPGTTTPTTPYDDQSNTENARNVLSIVYVSPGVDAPVRPSQDAVKKFMWDPGAQLKTSRSKSAQPGSLFAVPSCRLRANYNHYLGAELFGGWPGPSDWRRMETPGTLTTSYNLTPEMGPRLFIVAGDQRIIGSVNVLADGTKIVPDPTPASSSGSTGILQSARLSNAGSSSTPRTVSNSQAVSKVASSSPRFVLANSATLQAGQIAHRLPGSGVVRMIDRPISGNSATTGIVKDDSKRKGSHQKNTPCIASVILAIPSAGAAPIVQHFSAGDALWDVEGPIVDWLAKATIDGKAFLKASQYV